MDSSATTGIALLATGTVGGLVTALWLRGRVSPIAVIAVDATVGALLATGALLLLDPIPNLANWAAAVLFLSVACPVHFHVLFGRPTSGAIS